jgi:starch synthase
MRILLASSEAVPFSKTGGLADVASALAKALDRAGHQVWLIVPHYPPSVARNGVHCPPVEPTGQNMNIPVGSKLVTAKILWSELPRSNVTVLHVDQPEYFDRPQLYTEDGEDYKDNCERFVFFSRAVMETARRFVLRPDIVHTNDWQTGLVPALLAADYRHLPVLRNTASVFTIHNIAFQGQFWHWDMLLTGLDWKYFNWRQMESCGRLVT